MRCTLGGIPNATSLVICKSVDKVLHWVAVAHIFPLVSSQGHRMDHNMLSLPSYFSLRDCWHFPSGIDSLCLKNRKARSFSEVWALNTHAPAHDPHPVSPVLAFHYTPCLPDHLSQNREAANYSRKIQLGRLLRCQIVKTNAEKACLFGLSGGAKMQSLHNESEENERRSCGVRSSIFEEEGPFNSSLFKQHARRKEAAIWRTITSRWSRWSGLGRIPNPL